MTTNSSIINLYNTRMGPHDSLLEQPLKIILDWRNLTQLQSPDALRRYRVKLTGHVASLRRQVELKRASKEAVLVALAERDWAHAMETKSLLETSVSSKKKKRVISKLAKAVKYLSQISSPLTLQAQGYMNLVEAALAFEQKNWKKSVQYYSNARVVLVASAKLDADFSSIYQETVSSDIDPALRFAVSQSRVKRTTDLSTLAVNQVLSGSPDLVSALEQNQTTAHVLEQGRNVSNPSTELGGISWRNHTVSSVADPELASSILRAKNVDSNLSVDSSRNNVDAFDQVLLTWQEAVDIAHECIDKTEKSGQNAQDYYIVQTYCSFQVLLRRIQRDNILIRSLADIKDNMVRYRDSVRIFDTILQSVASLKDLPGVHQDEALSLDLDVAHAYFRANKFVCLALGHREMGNKKESLALLSRAKSVVDATNVTQYNGILPEYVLTQDAVRNTISTLDKEFKRAYGMAAFEHLQQNKSQATDLSVADSLNVFRVGNPRDILKNLISLSPKIEQVPMKPVLFDIAYNYVDYDETEMDQDVPSTSTTAAPVPQAEIETKKQPKRGLLGGLFGR